MNLSQNRGLLLVTMMAPWALINAWMAPEFAFLATAALCVISISAGPQRPSAFEAALPIHGRDIALARLITALAPGLAALALVAAVVLTRHRAAFSTMELTQAALFIVLANFLTRLVRASEFAVTPSDTAYPIALLTLASAGAVMYLPPFAVLALVAIATTTAGFAWWRSIPPSYQAASLAIDARRGRATTTDSAKAHWWRLITSTMFTKHRLFLGAIMVFGGATNQWQIFALMSLSVEDLWQRSRWLQPLPISHRARLWMILGPAAVLPMLLALVGMQIHIPGLYFERSLSRGAPDTFQYETGFFDSPTRVSMAYWDKAANGNVPKITAPWGETADPYKITIFKNVYYNPYSARRSSSERFTDWQFERLTKAVYGFSIERKDYVPATVRYRGFTQRPRMMVLNCSLALTVILLYLFFTGMPKFHKVWRTSTTVSWFSALLVVLPALGFLVAVVEYGMKQGAMDVFLPLVERQLFRLSAVLPHNILLVIAIALLPVAIMYSLLEWQFARSEIVGAVGRVK